MLKNESVKVCIMDDEIIHIIKPSSDEYKSKGQYIVVYENAYGDIEQYILTLAEIAVKYRINIRDFEDLL